MPPGKLIEINLINNKIKCATLKVMVAMIIMMMVNGSGDGGAADGDFIGNDNNLFILRIFVNTLPIQDKWCVFVCLLNNIFVLISTTTTTTTSIQTKSSQ